MLIQPVQPVLVTIVIGQNDYECQMVSLSDTQLELSCADYLDKDSQVKFLAKYFKGRAIVTDIKFCQHHFTYTLAIELIQFQPGLLINTRL